MAGYIGSKASVVSSGAERKTVITATAGQTSLTGLSYTPTQVHVFQNGVRLVDGTDYTATNGSSITLTAGASTNDQIVVLSYATVEISDAVPASSGGTFSGNIVVNNTLTTTNIKATGETASRAVSGVAAAWVNFNGTGTPAARDSFNHSSITDNGTGHYTNTVSSALANANYGVTAMSQDTSVGDCVAFDSATAPTTTAVRIYNFTTGSSVADCARICLSYHGDLA
jgi:hypothetical protein